MKTLQKLAWTLGLVSMVALGGCDASVGGTDQDGEATDGGADAGAGGGDATGGGGTGSDTSSGGGDTASGGDSGGTTPAAGFAYVTIDGAPDGNSDCKTNAVGADIDVIAVYRDGSLIGVGKPGTVKFQAGASPLCPTWGVSEGTCSYGTIKPICHNDPQDVAGGLNTKMYSDATPDTGYFGLGSGSVEVQIGGCSMSGADITTCDGNGPVVTLQAGDEIDVYEVDASYQKGSGSPAAGIAPDKCPNVCKPEGYEVWVGKTSGKVDVSLGKFTGSKSYIKVP